jgi:hypothetical protein
MEPRTGDIVLAEGKMISSWLIRAGTFSEFSHCETLFIPQGCEDKPEMWMVISAEGNGMKLMPITKYKRGKGKAHIYRADDVSDCDALIAHERGMGLVQEGIKYDWAGLAWVAVVNGAKLVSILSFNVAVGLFHVIANRLPNPIHDSHKLFCPEALAYQYAGFKKFADKPNSVLTPDNIAKAVSMKHLVTYEF